MVILITGIPILKDFPVVMSSSYRSVSGIALNQSISGKTSVKVRSITLVDEAIGEKIRRTFYGRYDIKSGDRLSFYYYPHSKIASYQNPKENRLIK